MSRDQQQQKRTFRSYHIVLCRLKSVWSSTLKDLQHLLGEGPSAGGILPCQQLPICRHNRLGSPRGRSLFIEAVGCNIERCLKVERHILLTIDLDLFLVAEASDSATLEQQIPIRKRGFQQRRGAVADRRDHLARVPELADQVVRGGVVDEIEHGAESADVEDRFVLGGFAEDGLELLGVLPEVFLGRLEFYGNGVGEELDGDGIEDCGAALRRSDCDVEVAGEDIVWVCKFGEIPALY